MANSRRLAALLELQSTVRRINAVDGYHYTVKPTSVVLDRVDLATIPPSELPFFCIYVPTSLSRERIAAMQVKETFRAQLQARVDADGTLDGRKTIAFENLLADIEKAITSNLNLAGIAVDVWCEPSSEVLMGLGNDNKVGLDQPLEIRLNARRYGAP